VVRQGDAADVDVFLEACGCGGCGPAAAAASHAAVRASRVGALYFLFHCAPHATDAGVCRGGGEQRRTWAEEAKPPAPPPGPPKPQPPSAGKAAEEGAEGTKWRVDDFFNSETGKIPAGLRDALRKQIKDAVDANARARGPSSSSGGSGGGGGGAGGGGRSPPPPPPPPGRGDKKTPLQELFEPRWRLYFAATGATLLWYWVAAQPAPRTTNWLEFKVRR
jgi:hypothetical protein